MCPLNPMNILEENIFRNKQINRCCSLSLGTSIRYDFASLQQLHKWTERLQSFLEAITFANGNDFIQTIHSPL